MHQGFEVNPLLKEADLALVVKNRTPWYPANMGPINGKVVVIDDSPFKLHMAYQNLQADAFLTGDVAATLKLLAEAVRAAKPDAGRVNERRARWTAAHAALEQRYRAAEKDARSRRGIQAVNLCATLGEALPDNTIYLDETTVHGGLNRRHVTNRGAQSYVAMRSGLGQGLGIALGVKKACPDRPVVTLIGDGAFLYNPSVQCFGFARDEKLPTLTVVYNNGGYRAMRQNQLSYYPDGAGARNKLFYGEPINGFAYEELPKLFGGLGIRVEDPAELRPALQKGHAAVMEGRSALINVILAD
jgi:acetolactate synthase I/II/III large subunit